jgi:hypothetical protein
MHDSMGLDKLLGDGLGNALRITSLELAREKITKPISGTILHRKKSQTHQPGAQKLTPGPLPARPVLKR